MVKSVTAKLLLLAIGTGMFAFSGQALAQEKPKDDPTAESDVIKETLKTIKEVEKLNEYIEQNKALKTENATLKAQLASLAKQITELTTEIKTQNDRLRKQLLSLPKLEVRSKVIGPSSAWAILKFGDKDMRIRDSMEMTVPVENGIWTLMKVEEISKDVIKLNFTELERVVTIFD